MKTASSELATWRIQRIELCQSGLIVYLSSDVYIMLFTLTMTFAP